MRLSGPGFQVIIRDLACPAVCPACHMLGLGPSVRIPHPREALEYGRGIGNGMRLSLLRPVPSGRCAKSAPSHRHRDRSKHPPAQLQPAWPSSQQGRDGGVARAKQGGQVGGVWGEGRGGSCNRRAAMKGFALPTSGPIPPRRDGRICVLQAPRRI